MEIDQLTMTQISNLIRNMRDALEENDAAAFYRNQMIEEANAILDHINNEFVVVYYP